MQNRFLNITKCLSDIQLSVAVNKRSVQQQKEQIKLREKLNNLVSEKTTEKKAPIFTGKMLPFYTKQELDNKLSPAEKEIAERSEYSGIDEAAESYHKNNP